MNAKRKQSGTRIVASTFLDVFEHNNYDPKVWPEPVSSKDIRVSLDLAYEPVSKARARFFVRKAAEAWKSGRIGSYTPERTNLYQKMIAHELEAALSIKGVDADNRFGLRCIFHRSNRQRIDVDNLIKAVSDAATGIVWKDDSQVLEMIGRVFLASKNPRIQVLIYTVPDTTPYLKCEKCGVLFVTASSQARRFCSSACSNYRERVQKNCEECNAIFYLTKASMRHTAARFCSRKCNLKVAMRNNVEGRERSSWRCHTCDGPVSRKEYTRCNNCKKIAYLAVEKPLRKLRYSDLNLELRELLASKDRESVRDVVLEAVGCSPITMGSAPRKWRTKAIKESRLRRLGASHMNDAS